MHWNSVYFTAPILNVAKGLGRQLNPYNFGESDAILLYTRDHSFNSHGMLNVLIFGQALSVKTYDILFRWYGVLNVLSILSYAILFRRALASHREHLTLAMSIYTYASAI